MYIDPVVINKTLCENTFGIHKIYLYTKLTLLLSLCTFQIIHTVSTLTLLESMDFFWMLKRCHLNLRLWSQPNGFKSHFCHVLVRWLWASCLTFKALIFSYLKIGIPALWISMEIKWSNEYKSINDYWHCHEKIKRRNKMKRRKRLTKRH